MSFCFFAFLPLIGKEMVEKTRERSTWAQSATPELYKSRVCKRERSEIHLFSPFSDSVDFDAVKMCGRSVTHCGC